MSKCRSLDTRLKGSRVTRAHVQVEEHLVDGQRKRLLVHRKGSTRAFPPHHPLIPVDYQLTGQPVLIGGSMGTCSYVLTGGPLCSLGTCLACVLASCT